MFQEEVADGSEGCNIGKTRARGAQEINNVNKGRLK